MVENEKGSTLVELLVTMLVMALLMGIGVPMIVRNIADAHLRDGMREGISLLRRVRAEAINQYEPRYVEFHFATDPDQFRVFAFRSGAWTQVETVALPKGVDLVIPNATHFPALVPDVPPAEVPAEVPASSVFFGTRGGYPPPPDPSVVPPEYILRFQGRFSFFRNVAVARSTGVVTRK